MRLRPFTLNASIPDLEKDSNLFFANPDAVDDRDLFNYHFPQTIHFEPTPETVEQDEIDTEHGIVYYEHAQRLTDRTQLQPIPENAHQSFERPLDDPVVRTNTNDKYQVEPDEAARDNFELPNTSIRTQVTSRNNSTRYNLRSELDPEFLPRISRSRTPSQTRFTKAHAGRIANYSSCKSPTQVFYTLNAKQKPIAGTTR